MGAADPEGTVGLENTSRRFQLPDVSLVIFLEPYRAHRVTTSIKLRFRVVLEGDGVYDLEVVR